MPEILTESFCERCGTRYTFESATPRGAKLKGIRVLSRGLKNFVMSDDTSMDEAMAAARSETDREVTTHQLDAFHKTFNFCMSCRQYTCGNCWNEPQNLCLSCAPNLGQEIMPAPFPGLDATSGIGLAAADNGANGHDGISPSGYADLPTFDTSAWPSSDLAPALGDGDFLIGDTPPPADMLIGDTPPPADMLIGDTPPADMLIGDTPPVPPVLAAEPPIAAESAPELVASAEPPAAPVEPVPAPQVEPIEPVIAAVPTPHPDEHDARAAAAAAQTAAMLQRFRPGQSLDEALAAYESEQESIEAEPQTPPTTSEAPAQPVEAAVARPVPAAEPEAVVHAAPMPAPEPVIEPEPVVAPAAMVPETPPEPPLEPVLVEPEPVVAEAAVAEAAVEAPAPQPAPEPEPVAAESPAEPAPEPVAAEPKRIDIVEQPTWQIVAPEEPPVAAQPVVPLPVVEPPVAPIPVVPPPAAPGPVTPAATAEPQWPTQPQWPQAQPSANGLPFLGRPAVPGGGLESLWAESAREVSAAPTETTRAGVQSCVSCGLSLSATARFCRRCGTRQG